MAHYIIRKISLAHCKKGPRLCEKCREMNEGKISLLELHLPGEGNIQRRAIKVNLEGEEVWREFDIVRVFAAEEEAQRYAEEHDIKDVIVAIPH